MPGLNGLFRRSAYLPIARVLVLAAIGVGCRTADRGGDGEAPPPSRSSSDACTVCASWMPEDQLGVPTRRTRGTPLPGRLRRPASHDAPNANPGLLLLLDTKVTPADGNGFPARRSWTARVERDGTFHLAPPLEEGFLSLWICRGGEHSLAESGWWGGETPDRAPEQRAENDDALRRTLAELAPVPGSYHAAVTVLDAGSRAPIEGARVCLVTGAGGCAVPGREVQRTDSKGMVAWREIPIGYFYEVWADGYAPVRQVVVEARLAEPPVDDFVVLHRADPTKGQVRMERGEIPSETWISCSFPYPEGDGDDGNATAARGRWDIPVPPHGQVEFPLPKGARATMRVTTPGFEDCAVEVVAGDSWTAVLSRR
jgi:hypothetical protein